MSHVHVEAEKNIKNAAGHEVVQMEQRIKVEEIIIVEGLYDKARLKQYLEADIIPTNGFAIFKDKDILSMIKMGAEKRGIVVLTDSDRAGFLIRNRIKSTIPPQYVKHAYIPEIRGKEKRKSAPSKEGMLGVEGVPANIVIDALRKSGCRLNGSVTPAGNGRAVTKQDLFADGLTGKPDSAKKRQALCRLLSFPSRLSTNALLDAINALFDYEQYKEIVNKLSSK
jgi:ribonuclease M5